MIVEPLDVVILGGAILGGALGAYLARTAAWKGALVAGAATIASVAFLTLAGIENPLLDTLAYLVLVAMLGLPLKLGPRRLANIVIGSFLVPFAAALFFTEVFAA